MMVMVLMMILTWNYYEEEELYNKTDYAAIAIERELPLHHLI